MLSKSNDVAAWNSTYQVSITRSLFLYDPDFVDNKETVIIIDEIQESHEIYNRIREFTRQFGCFFIVTGSYLGRVLEPELRYSSGDITKIRIYTLSYEEFLEAINPEMKILSYIEIYI